MSSISNIYLQYATTLDSHYKTIDDYIMEKYLKNKEEKNDNNNLLTGVKSSHQKYYDLFYDPVNKKLPFKSKYANNIRDNITKCPNDYSNQIKTMLKNNNIVPQIPGYTKDDILHELRYVNNNTNTMKNTKYNRNIPFPTNPDFFKK